MKLQLSQVIKIYNIFHLNLLKKASTNPLTDQVNEPILPDEDQKWYYTFEFYNFLKIIEDFYAYYLNKSQPQTRIKK